MRSLLLQLFLIGSASSALSQQPATQHTEHHAPGAISDSLKVTANGQTTTLSLADLYAMPQHSMTVHNSHSDSDESYTGVSLADLLAKYGLTVTGDGAKQVYHSYVRAEGTDGYFVIFSASELESTLHTGDSLIALTLAGKPLQQDGRLKMVLAGERKPARWIRNLQTLSIVSVQ